MSRIKRAHGFAAVRVEGGLLPPESLREIASQKARHQADEDYRISRSLQLKDELGRFWHIARDLWKLYQLKRRRTDLDQQKVTTEFLVSFFRDVLGYYDLQTMSGASAEGRHFAITHRGADGQIPILFVSHRYELDRAEARFGDEGRRRSPANLLQEYLNADERAQWGIVSNGGLVRLLRDNPSLTRPAYIECDLELMLTDEIYADFTAMWLLLHDSRLRGEEKQAGGTIMEQWRLQAHATGERALVHLREGVTEALRLLGSGFLAHQANDGLRDRVAGGTLSAQTYYQQLLRLVYRFLFLFTVEDRDLLFPPGVQPESRRVYAEGYSLAMLRERALRRGQDEQHSDLWQGIQIVFRGLAGDLAVQEALGVPALDGLFAEGQCPDLEDAYIGNTYLLRAIRALAYFKTESGLARINYRDMDTEELGSVYEGLLELHPQFQVEMRPWTFAFLSDVADVGARGSERKSTGSYYTPTSLVEELIKSALEPVMAKAVADHPENPRQAILDLKVIDPACGSGHFLLAAARRMAAEIARFESDGAVPDEQARRHALREVVQYCIHGVDKNPLAVELCRAALWMETIEPGKPLSFLDAHIQWGDSLIGLRDPSVLEEGIPMDAYKALTGDQPEAERELKRRNKTSVSDVQLNFFEPAAVPEPEETEVDVESMPEETLADVAVKRAQWLASRGRRKWTDARDAADLYVAAFFLRKRLENIDLVPVNQDLARLAHKQPGRPGVLEVARRMAEKQGFLHWHLAFPQVAKRGGFDVVLGNPPWERVKLQEQEFFASRSREIAEAPNKAARDRLIRALGRPNATPSERLLLQAFEQSKRAAEASSLFIRTAGRYPLTGTGDVNTYAVFSELFLNLVSATGRAGLIVPTGISTDDSTKALFAEISSSKRVASLFSFENEEFIFPSVHHAFRFCLLTLTGTETQIERPVFVFFARQPEQIYEKDRRFTLSPDEISLINPNTRTCPVLRSTADAELAKKLYARVPVLLHEGQTSGNPWKISLLTMFHMSADSGMFRTSEQLDVAELKGGPLLDRRGITWLPLYEAKMVHQYDHRYNTYNQAGTGVLDVDVDRKQNPQYEILPRYWVEQGAVLSHLTGRGWSRSWLYGFRSIARSTDERTAIGTVIPAWSVGHKVLLAMFGDEITPQLMACWAANFNSLVFDYLIRQKVGGTDLGFFQVKQIPMLPPSAYEGQEIQFVTDRILELVYTSESLRSFAEDLGYLGAPFSWDPDRRAVLRAELDAFYACKYGLSRDELRFILDPSDAYGMDYPSQTFRVLRENEVKELGEYRTQRLVLEAWERLPGPRQG